MIHLVSGWFCVVRVCNNGGSSDKRTVSAEIRNDGELEIAYFNNIAVT